MKKRWILAAGAAGYLRMLYGGHRDDPRIAQLKAQKYYAHRGLFDPSLGIPENSMAAFRRARDYGFGMEFDIQLTKDGVPVILHDFSLERMVYSPKGTPVSGGVKDYTLAELMEFRLTGSEERIPVLADVLQEIHGEVPLIAEIKVPGCRDSVAPVCQAVLDALREYNGLYCVESFDPRAVLWFCRNAPDVIRGQLYEDIYRSGGTIMYKASASLLTGFLTKPDFIAYHWNHRGMISGAICRTFYPMMSVAWTVRSPAEVEKAGKQFDVFIFEGFIPEM